MGKAPKAGKGYSGKTKRPKYISRNKALRKLQLPLPAFRKLCILKGIFPYYVPAQQRKKNKSLRKNKAYYAYKDILFLEKEPLVDEIRKVKTMKKKVQKFEGRKDTKRARKMEEIYAPDFSLDHVIRERYPTFQLALEDMDDALTMLATFAHLHAGGNVVTPDIVDECQKLMKQWEFYVVKTRSLTKSYLTIKGIYYQAEMEGTNITWVVPYQFTNDGFGNVDLKVMRTFNDLYLYLSRFVIYKLYHDRNMPYPPKFVQDGQALMLRGRKPPQMRPVSNPQVKQPSNDIVAGLQRKLVDMQRSSNAEQLFGKDEENNEDLEEQNENEKEMENIDEELSDNDNDDDQEEEEEEEEENEDVEINDDSVDEDEEFDINSEGPSDEEMSDESDENNDNEEEEENEEDNEEGEESDNNSDTIDPTNTVSVPRINVSSDNHGKVDGDDTQDFVNKENETLSLAERMRRKRRTLFEGYVVFVNRECPVGALQFIIMALGGRVGWESHTSPFDRDYEYITHEIVDRPSLRRERVHNRKYVQPQWVFDCLNAGIILPEDRYAVGAELPPHLSPFVDWSQQSTIPDYAKEIQALIGETFSLAQPELEQPQELEEQVDQQMEETQYARELEAELEGKRFTEQQQAEDKYRKQERLKQLQKEKSQEKEQLKLRELQLSGKTRRYYQQAKYHEKRKESRANVVAKRASLLEKGFTPKDLVKHKKQRRATKKQKEEKERQELINSKTYKTKSQKEQDRKKTKMLQEKRKAKMGHKPAVRVSK